MSSSTGVGQRLYILLSVLAALAAPIGFFLVRGAEDALLNTILKECQGDRISLFSVCFNKALRESKLAFWQYLLPFVPAVLLACGRWVLGTPRSWFGFSKFRLYLVAEGFFVVIGILLTLMNVYETAVKHIDNVDTQIEIVLRSFYLALAAIGAPVILSLLLKRDHVERSYKFVRLGILIVLIGPIAGIAMIIFRQASGVP